MTILNVLCGLAGCVGFFLVANLIQAIDNDDVQFLLGILVLCVPTLVTAIYVADGGMLSMHFIYYGSGWVTSIIAYILYATIIED